MKRRLSLVALIGPILIGALSLLAGAVQAAAITPAEVKVKKALADSMTAEELAAYKQRLADRVNQGLLDRGRGNPVHAPADICTAATPEFGPLPYLPLADTTIGQTDN